MPPFARFSHVWLAAAAISALVAQATIAHAVTSKTISCVLHEPLPSEDISLTADDGPKPVKLELIPSSTRKSALPEKTVPADELTLKHERIRGG
jgi:hypothetical protein